VLVLPSPVLAYSTYLGGSGDDFGSGIAVDSAGNAYVTGETTSTDFPTGSFQNTNAGGRDAFVTKLNAAGTALVYSTYLGGSGFEEGVGIAVDSSNNAYVTGATTSTDFPTASFQNTNAGGQDAFVTKLAQAFQVDCDPNTPKANIIIGTTDPDSLSGTSDKDVIFGLGGDDYIAGLSGNDCLDGGTGKDHLDGGTGKDQLFGGEQDDRLDGGTDNDQLFGGPGNDRLNGGTGKDRLFGEEGNDTLLGGTNNDFLDGGPDTDTCNGGSGSNTILNCSP